MAPEQALLTPGEVAARLSVSRATLYRMADAGMLPGAVRVGAQWRVEPKALEAWVHGDAEGRQKRG
jgi:excisionase family DNA binding protein